MKILATIRIMTSLTSGTALRPSRQLGTSRFYLDETHNHGHESPSATSYTLAHRKYSMDASIIVYHCYANGSILRV